MGGEEVGTFHLSVLASIHKQVRLYFESTDLWKLFPFLLRCPRFEL